MSPQSVAKPFLTAQGSFCSCLALQFNKSAKMFVPKPRSVEAVANTSEMHHFDHNSSGSSSLDSRPNSLHGAENLDSESSLQGFPPASPCWFQHRVSPHRSHGGAKKPRTGPFLQHPFKKISLKRILAPILEKNLLREAGTGSD